MARVRTLERLRGSALCRPQPSMPKLASTGGFLNDSPDSGFEPLYTSNKDT